MRASPEEVLADPQTAGSVTCERCGVTLPRALAKPTGVRIVPGGDFELGEWRCGDECVSAGLAVSAATRTTCVGYGCNAPMQRTPGTNGRPQLYCDEKCRSRTRRVLDETIRDLAMDRLPRNASDPRARLAEAKDMHARALFLYHAWMGGDSRDRSRQFPDHLDKPSRRARTGLAAWMRKLAQAIKDAQMAVVEAERVASDEARDRRAAQAVEKAQAADRSWRDQLLGKKSTPAEPVDEPVRALPGRSGRSPEAQADAVRKALAAQAARQREDGRPEGVTPDGWE